jgi:signal transduction histidine kinase
LGDAEKYLVDLGEIAQQALKEMRLLVYQLRPAILEQEGLVGALQQRLDAVERRSSIETRLLVDEALELPALVEEGLYRIVQEALNNTLKHASATCVTVHIHVQHGQLGLEVIDNGRGFDHDGMSYTGGLGLVSMKERAEKLGGLFTVLSKPGEGTTIKVSVKIPQ